MVIRSSCTQKDLQKLVHLRAFVHLHIWYFGYIFVVHIHRLLMEKVLVINVGIHASFCSWGKQICLQIKSLWNYNHTHSPPSFLAVARNPHLCLMQTTPSDEAGDASSNCLDL